MSAQIFSRYSDDSILSRRCVAHVPISESSCWKDAVAARNAWSLRGVRGFSEPWLSSGAYCDCPWEAPVIRNVSITCSWRGASLYLQHRILREIAWVWSLGCRRSGMQLGRAQVFEYEMHAHSSMATSRVQVRAAWARRRTRDW